MNDNGELGDFLRSRRARLRSEDAEAAFSGGARDQSIVLYATEPGSASAETLRLLAGWTTPTNTHEAAPSQAPYG
ncbi:hypothetical protein ACIA8E_24425 [Streptomyces sp. NPDC051664]|uniref:hypothetical protein n=1 Tax=Streptomyces sp. NPDC051664 TaxID=3365668 RepID=UPI0037A802DA